MGSNSQCKCINRSQSFDCVYKLIAEIPGLTLHIQLRGEFICTSKENKCQKRFFSNNRVKIEISNMQLNAIFFKATMNKIL